MKKEVYQDKREHETTMPYCWCNPRNEVQSDGSMRIIHNIATKIIKEDDDMVLRASIGGTENIGYYCTYRGDETEIIAMLEQVLFDLKCKNKIQNEK
ncbi:hypothetical protein E6Q11_04300 [Candidatus Dojkabacteria bacterium]|uniref:Uncharacterized protein n=1 Tax=Candidatus Dojkabacteria bacterium TaxID=2099670 RepID=A0A5C7J4Z6_9BACT|nr:MAG: hypothetical protein E6Q11_04300 [Candidatus Dojkabacteria bacterium]